MESNKIPSHYSLRVRKPSDDQKLCKPNSKRKATNNPDSKDVKQRKVPAKAKKVQILNVCNDHNKRSLQFQVNKTSVGNHYQSSDEEDISKKLPTNLRSILRSSETPKKNHRVSWNPDLVEEIDITPTLSPPFNSKSLNEDFDFHFNQILEIQLDTNGPKVIVEPIETEIFAATISNLLLQPINKIEDVPIQAEFQSRLNANEDLHDIMDSFLNKYEEGDMEMR
nr:uncharacterized protein LOC111414617 [Onthophagus taurus]